MGMSTYIVFLAAVWKWVTSLNFHTQPMMQSCFLEMNPRYYTSKFCTVKITNTFYKIIFKDQILWSKIMVSEQNCTFPPTQHILNYFQRWYMHNINNENRFYETRWHRKGLWLQLFFGLSFMDQWFLKKSKPFMPFIQWNCKIYFKMITWLFKLYSQSFNLCEVVTS